MKNVGKMMVGLVMIVALSLEARAQVVVRRAADLNPGLKAQYKAAFKAIRKKRSGTMADAGSTIGVAAGGIGTAGLLIAATTSGTTDAGAAVAILPPLGAGAGLAVGRVLGKAAGAIANLIHTRADRRLALQQTADANPMKMSFMPLKR